MHASVGSNSSILLTTSHSDLEMRSKDDLLQTKVTAFQNSTRIMSSKFLLLAVLLTVSVPLITAQSGGVACLIMDYNFPIQNADAFVLIGKVAANNIPVPELPPLGTIPIYTYKTASAYVQNAQTAPWSLQASDVNTALSAIYDSCWGDDGDYPYSSGGIATSYDANNLKMVEFGIVFTGTGP